MKEKVKKVITMIENLSNDERSEVRNYFSRITFEEEVENLCAQRGIFLEKEILDKVVDDCVHGRNWDSNYSEWDNMNDIIDNYYDGEEDVVCRYRVDKESQKHVCKNLHDINYKLDSQNCFVIYNCDIQNFEKRLNDINVKYELYNER